MCRTCGQHPAVREWLVCALCADRQQRAEEAAARVAAAAAYEAGIAHRAALGTLDFIPANDRERREHRQARRKINFGSAL